MLNVYKCSGIGRVDDVENSRYQYYTGLTCEATNTVAFNFLLSEVNLRIVEYELAPIKEEQISLLNDLDLLAVSLEGLMMLKEHPNKYDIILIGSVICQMITDGLFEADFTDDQRRSDNLDILIGKFKGRLEDAELTEFNGSFADWWNEKIVAYNYNEVTDAQVNRFISAFETEDKTGAVTVAQQQTLADKIIEAGDGFLYMFIPEDEVKKYNSVVRYKRRGEWNENFEYIKKTTYGMYNDEAIINMLRLGIMQNNKMTPETLLKDLFDKGEKVGSIEVVLMWVQVIAAIVSILTSLFALIMSIYQVSYEVPDNYDGYAPAGEDLGELMEQERTNALEEKSSSWILPVVLIALLLFFTKKDKK